MVLYFWFRKVFILLINITHKMNCELCGKETEELFLAFVEGTEINVCTNCTGFGKVIKKIKAGITVQKKVVKPIILEQAEPSLILSADFGGLIKSKREQLGLSQKDFALKINEKMSPGSFWILTAKRYRSRPQNLPCCPRLSGRNLPHTSSG